MEIKEIIKEDIYIYRLSGEFTYETKEPLHQRITEVLEEGIYKFIFNVESLEYLDSSALGLMIKSAKSAFAKGLHIKISNANQRITHVIEQAKLHMLIDLVADEETAISELDGK